MIANRATVRSSSSAKDLRDGGSGGCSSLGRRQASRSASRRTQKTGQKPGPTLTYGGSILKNKKMSIRIADADLEKIHHKADQANMSMTDYITACCLEKQIVNIDGLDEVIRQQKAIGRNLNQLTTLANMGRVKTVYLQELAEQYRQIASLISEILKRKRWDDGTG